jgi:transcriptional regulator with XRE-family HTH domain
MNKVNASAYAGNVLKDLRKKKRLSQTKIGNALGVTYQMIQKYECGSTPLSLDKIQVLSKELGVEPSAFLKESK